MYTALFELIKTEINKANSVKSESIVNAISEAIERKVIERDSRLPSVNESVKGLSVARTTVVKAYKELINRGVIKSKPRYGYFVISEDTKRKVKVMLLLHSLNPFQEQLYNAFEESVGDFASVEVYFHHCNIEVFKNLILDKQNQYGLFVITPYTHPEMAAIISQIPSEKILIIDQLAGLQGYSYICQNFYEKVLEVLPILNDKLKKYKQGCLIFPDSIEFPLELKKAFTEYATSQNFPWQVQASYKKIEKESVYIVFTEKDLVGVVKEAKKTGWELGKDIGLISYNDTSVKEIIADGVTVISTDFQSIGFEAGNFVKSRISTKTIIPTKVILRNSL